MSQKKSFQHLVIVGGGTAGWMTAAALSQHFQGTGLTISLVESSQIGTIGVGEATIPTLRRFYQKLGFSDLDVIKATKATGKLGIEFQDWQQIGKQFIHPFGLFGQSTKEVPFHHYWHRAKQSGSTRPLAKYSLAVQMAKNNKFALPKQQPKSQLEIFDWALHFDASLFAKLMKNYALAHGVNLIDDKITQVELKQDSGEISRLILEKKPPVSGDLFIDCSGFQSLLHRKALQTPYIDWSQWLVCDRAIALSSESNTPPLSRTIAKAHSFGWQWQIPLQHRTGNGIVFASQFASNEQALNQLLANIPTEALNMPLDEPKVLHFTPGRCEQAWNKNCIAIGLSSGFLEPLESTSIALIETAIGHIQKLLPTTTYSQNTIEEFNQISATEYERVRDFIIAHYALSKRNDSAMWQYCQTMELPQSLENKLNTYKNQGNIETLPWEIFGKDSWLAIFDGFNVTPHNYHPKANNMPIDYLQQQLEFMAKTVSEITEKSPTHQAFLAQI